MAEHLLISRHLKYILTINLGIVINEVIQPETTEYVQEVGLIKVEFMSECCLKHFRLDLEEVKLEALRFSS